jgi:hypothetical protein
MEGRVERRGPRYPFVANLELLDLQSGVHLQGRITVLSLYGCGIAAIKPFSAGTRVRVGITYEGATFGAIGRIAYSTSDGGMGIVFVQIEQGDQTLLEKWISELRG